ncbi:MAG TPA: hypothetical protein VGF92_03945 [Stellaceae bacterium]|jgi:hypothetical protein
MALLHKLRRNLADLIDPESDRQHEQPPVAKPTGAVSAELLYDRIRILVPAGRNRSVRAGQVNLISFAPIRDRLGSQWPHYAVQADRIARNAIERYLIGGDIYTRWKDEGYVVVFATLDFHQAQVKCNLIGDEITKKLLGEEAQDLAEIRHVEVQPDGTVTFSQVPGFEDLVALTIGLEAGRARPSGGALPIGAAELSSPAAAVTKASDPVAELTYSYRPSWDPGHGVIAAYLCVPTLPELPGSARRARAASVLRDDVASLERLDFATLGHAMGVVEGLVRDKRRLLITVPVRFETLCAAANRRRYIEILDGRLSSEAAPLLVIELVGVPAGVPEARLHEISSPLRAHARAVIARLRPDITDFSQFLSARVAAVGCDLGEQNGSELALMQQMARFSRAAAKTGVATYLRGISSLSLAAAALGAGFAHLDGDAIAPMVDQPHGVVQFGLADLYNPSFKG